MIVEAFNKQEAIEMFRKQFPDRTPGIYNYPFDYTESSWRQTILINEREKVMNTILQHHECDNHAPYVYAVRLFLEDGYKPMAELAFGEGGRPNGQTTIIHWDNISEREKYCINAYTFIWDERPVVRKKTFHDFVNNC